MALRAGLPVVKTANAFFRQWHSGDANRVGSG